MKPPDKAIDCWHFIGADKKLGYKDGRKVIKGRTLSILNNKPIKLCENGLHGSRKVFDALAWSNQSDYLCKVKIWGDVQKDERKLAGRHRYCEYIVKWERVYGLSIVDYLKDQSKGKYKSILTKIYKYFDKKINKKELRDSIISIKGHSSFDIRLRNFILSIYDDYYYSYYYSYNILDRYVLARIEKEIRNESSKKSKKLVK